METQGTHTLSFRDTAIEQFSESEIAAACERGFWVDHSAIEAVQPTQLAVNTGTFIYRSPDGDRVTVAVLQAQGHVTVSSDFPGEEGVLTAAEGTVLMALLRREELGLFFKSDVRQQKLRQAAVAYGLEHEPDLDRYLMPVVADGRLMIQPRMAGLLPLTSPKFRELSQQAESAQQHPNAQQQAPDRVRILVFSRHKYYRHPVVELIDADRTKSGGIKAPYHRVAPLEQLATSNGVDEAKLYAAIATLQQVTSGDRMSADLTALHTVIRTGTNYPFYYHDEQFGENYSSKSLVPATIEPMPNTVSLTVRAEGPFYAITGKLSLAGKGYPLHKLPLMMGCLFSLKDKLYLANSTLLLSVVTLLREHGGKLLIHARKYRDFQRQLLDKLAETIRVEYPDLKLGTAKQLAETGFAAPPERLIYLSDFGPHVMIIPVVRYGDAEVAIRTEKQVKAIDAEGNDFKVPRDDAFEQDFIAMLIKQHPYFPEQLDNQLYYFYLHRKYFLDAEWFLPVFDTWREDGIEIFGFNELSDNKLNPNKISITVKVISGINWFNATHEVRFGRKKASLKKIQAALRNKRNYVVLDDGTQGILPQQWIEKFTRYFQEGEVIDEETIRFAKANFETVTALYDAAMLDEAVTAEIGMLRERLADLENIPSVPEPVTLRTELRPYQQEGLNWLCFLDKLGFGGILADEMGLGKTVQIIAFMLSKRAAGRTGTDLVVVPATLIFNWQQELATLAPSLQVLTLYGNRRTKSPDIIRQHDVVLTSYTTLLGDIRFLKDIDFNYIYLDESQHIKNPDSQRYKAVRLLTARNRVAISGTPFENSSFDLYGQLSFACPGLLGDKRYFRDVYGKPIDQFKNQKRRKELQQKIQPFILRRTKQQVAADLPEKFSSVLYCEMGKEQRKIYDAYEKEFRDFVDALSGEELEKSSMHVLRGLTWLRQICNSPALLPDGMLNKAVSAKVELLKEQIKDKSPYHKVVVFSQFVSMLQLIGRMLGELSIQYVSLTGGTREREKVVKSFQEDAEIRVFLVSLKAGGTGLNLTAAEIVYLVDPWWNPAVEAQAIDRVHRIGQGKKVTAYRLVTPGTVEEKVLQLQATKRTLADGLVGNGVSFWQSLFR